MKSLFALPVAFALLANPLRADVVLPDIFSDNMVLQQGLAAPVWGKAEPGETVTVSIAGQTVATVADEHGKWRVKLAPMSTDNLPPLTLTVSGSNTITVQNVLVGEVWLCSGQSNMQMALRNVQNAPTEMAAANYPTIRLFTVQRRGSPQPLEDVEGKWLVCTPKEIERFSAVPYFFGRDLQELINRPLGLINSSYGGTAIEWWTRLEVLMTDPQTKKEVEVALRELDDPARVEARLARDMVKYNEAAAKAKAGGKEFRQPLPQRPGPEYQRRPGALYNAMIHPLLGFGIRGILWYQGENNHLRGEQYSRLLPKMIADWRQQWGLGELPFFIVQLPPINQPQNTPMPARMESTWAELREAQAKTLAVPNTAMAVTIDTAADGDLHPKDKQTVGNRLARLAAHMVYSKPVACFSPMFKAVAQEGDSLRLSFSHADGGLTTQDGGPVQGFAIAGADKNFVWAEARIEGDQVVVSSPEVKAPVAVRYGWANHPIISVFNKDGLPLAPFRTDDWPMPTFPWNERK